MSIRGGHDIPSHDIHRRYEHSRLNLIALLPHLITLHVYDNSRDADPSVGRTPKPVPVVHMKHGKILGPPEPGLHAELGQTDRRCCAQAAPSLNPRDRSLLEHSPPSPGYRNSPVRQIDDRPVQ